MDSPRSKKVPLRFLPAFSFGCPYVNREFLDDSLAWKLLKAAQKGDAKAVEQLDYMARFNEEFHRLYFRDGKDTSKALHNTQDLKSKAQDSFNSRRKDLWGSRSRRLPLSPNNIYPDHLSMTFAPDHLDEKLIASVEQQALTRGEIILATGIKKWIVYARVKCLQQYGFIRLIKKQSSKDLIRFISTKTPA